MGILQNTRVSGVAEEHSWSAVWKKWFWATTAFGVGLCALHGCGLDVWWFITRPAAEGWTASYLAAAHGAPARPDCLWQRSPAGPESPRRGGLRCWHQDACADRRLSTGAWNQCDGRTEVICSQSGDRGERNHSVSRLFSSRILKYFTRLLRHFIFCHSVIIYIPFFWGGGG